MLFAPINPADINQIEGVYPIKPIFDQSGFAIAGNEGLARVSKAAADVSTLKVGDFVIPSVSSFGTWAKERVCDENSLIKLDMIDPNDKESLKLGSMISVNPTTAFRMLKDFVKLNSGDVVVQNAANSSVGQAVIQLCKAWDLKTVNVIRDRPDFEDVSNYLKSLGADIVLKENKVRDNATIKLVKELGGPPKLALNCVGGKSPRNLVTILNEGGHMVTYGGMSKEPIQLPTTLLLFKDIHFHGFWMTRWYARHSIQERKEMLDEILLLGRRGRFKNCVHEIVEFESLDNTDAIEKLFETKTKKLLKF